MEGRSFLLLIMPIETLRLEIGALCLKPSAQLAAHKLPKMVLATIDHVASAIVTLRVHGMLSDKAHRDVVNKLMRKVASEIVKNRKAKS